MRLAPVRGRGVVLEMEGVDAVGTRPPSGCFDFGVVHHLVLFRFVADFECILVA